MKIGILDVETTTSNKGNPFDLTNRLVTVGLKEIGKEAVIYDTWDEILDQHLSSFDMLIGHNIKFDLHWLRNVGYTIQLGRVWDTMIGEYILTAQKAKIASLDTTLEKYGFPLKLNIVRTEYWDKGIDTPDIPRDILDEYLIGDLVATERVYLKQLEQFEGEHKGKLALFKLHNLDLIEIQEMEYNGVRFNTKKAQAYVNEIDKQVAAILARLDVFAGNIPINYNSDDHVSALLYGGTITEDVRIPVGVFKTGKKVGQPRYKIVVNEYELPRVIKPIAKSGRFKKGDDPDNPRYWLTNEKVISRLKPNKEGRELLILLKKYTGLEKLRNTYLLGWTQKILDMNWEEDTLHGNLNQCIVVTGRLSGTQPNLQNPDPITKLFCETRY